MSTSKEPVTFGTTIVGDQLRDGKKLFTVLQKLPSHRLIRLQHGDKEVAQMSERNFDATGFTLEAPAPDPK